MHLQIAAFPPLLEFLNQSLQESRRWTEEEERAGFRREWITRAGLSRTCNRSKTAGVFFSRCRQSRFSRGEVWMLCPSGCNGALASRTPGNRLERRCDEGLPTGLGPGLSSWPFEVFGGSTVILDALFAARLGNHRAASPEGAQAFACLGFAWISGRSFTFLGSRSGDPFGAEQLSLTAGAQQNQSLGRRHAAGRPQKAQQREHTGA